MLQPFIPRLDNTISQESVPEKSVSKLHQDFTVGEELGKGGFGQIVKVRRNCDENEYAIKIIKFDESNSDDMAKKRREAQTLSMLDHKNIVRYFNSWVETAQVPIAEYNQMFTLSSEESLTDEMYKLSANKYIITESSSSDNDTQNDEEYEEEEDDSKDNSIVFKHSDDDEYRAVSYLCIQMELCDNRTLRTVIDQNLFQDEKKLTKYFTEICEALSYIHEKNIVHRDLKPENIFLTSNDVIKIGDFGLCKEISLMGGVLGSDVRVFNYVCGTPGYVAPELWNEQLPTIKSDMYSLGVIYFEMCSKPMTEMEMQNIFPPSNSILDKLGVSPKRKYIIRSLLNANGEKRPTCDNILVILKSQKSLEEIKLMITQKKHIPPQKLKSVFFGLENLRKNETRMSLLTTASKIFEQHGAQNIPMPTFLPPLDKLTDNLTTLLNENGKSSSISNTSRIAFSYFVALNDIRKMRRYSIGKVFENGYFQPIEMHECVLHCLSPEINDTLTDAEMLYIAKTLHDKLVPNPNEEIRFIINHKEIYWTLLKMWKIKDQEAWAFNDVMIKLSNKISTGEDIASLLSSLDLDKDKIVSISKMITPRTISEAEKEIRTAYRIRARGLGVAFTHLEAIVQMAQTFGIKSENIFLSPLLLVQKQCSGFMFKVETSQQVLATGGNFEPLIKKFKKKSRQNRKLDFSTVELSFNCENFVDYLFRQRPFPLIYQPQLPPKPDVLINATERHEAIPLYQKLLSLDLKCDIVKPFSGIIYPGYFSYLIILRTNNLVTVFARVGTSPVYEGDWRNCDFEKICPKI